MTTLGGSSGGAAEGIVGFVGLGNVGGKLAGSLRRNGVELVVRDLDPAATAPFVEGGAAVAASPRELAERCDVVITCLPSPAACASVMESADGLLAGWRAGAVWITTPPATSTASFSAFGRLAMRSTFGSTPP